MFKFKIHEYFEVEAVNKLTGNLPVLTEPVTPRGGLCFVGHSDTLGFSFHIWNDS